MPNFTLSNPDLILQQGFGNLTTLIYPFFSTFTYPMTSSIGSFTYYGTVTSPLTRSVDVSEYNNHAVQIFLSASANANATSSVTILSSIDGVNWIEDFTFTGTTISSSINRISGRRRYIQALSLISTTGTGSITSSAYLLSGQ
jgi:hypothetical protein